MEDECEVVGSNVSFTLGADGVRDGGILGAENPATRRTETPYFAGRGESGRWQGAAVVSGHHEPQANVLGLMGAGENRPGAGPGAGAGPAGWYPGIMDRGGGEGVLGGDVVLGGGGGGTPMTNGTNGTNGFHRSPFEEVARRRSSSLSGVMEEEDFLPMETDD